MKFVFQKDCLDSQLVCLRYKILLYMKQKTIAEIKKKIIRQSPDQG